METLQKAPRIIALLKIIGLAAVAILLLVTFGPALRLRSSTLAAAMQPQKEKSRFLEYDGEVIEYEVRFGRVRLGTARFVNHGQTGLNGQPVGLMVFETKLVRFKDIEEIYSDLQTLLPIEIRRRVFNWLSTEQIVERYDQKEYLVTITKAHHTNPQTVVIKKDAVIHNALLLPYSVRTMPVLSTGQVIEANLPNRKIELTLRACENVTVPAGTFLAYHFISNPRQIEIWITADQSRIPVKIQGAGVFGYALVMSRYQPPVSVKK